MRKTQVNASFQPGSHFTRHIRAKIKTLVTGFQCDPFIIQISGRKEILVGLATTGNTQVQFRAECLLFHSIAPVGVP